MALAPVKIRKIPTVFSPKQKRAKECARISVMLLRSVTPSSSGRGEAN